MRFHPITKLSWWRGTAACALLALATQGSTQAQDVLIEARTGDFQYSEISGNWQNSSVHTSAPGTTAGIGSRFNTTVGSSFSLNPFLTEGGTYILQIALPDPSSQTSDAVVTIDVVGATFTEFGPTTSLNGTVVETLAFREVPDSQNWRTIGTLALDAGVSFPTFTFTFVSGSERFYADAFRFLDASDPCLNGLPVLNTVNGPLAAGQTFVNVPGVDPTATKVTVYADGVQIGQLDTGIVGGDTIEVVTTPALVAGQTITVTQHDGNDVESCRPNTGPIVGGGANPTVRISYSLRMDPALTGPIGAEGTSSSTWLWMLGATGPAAGFGTAPLGGTVLSPSTCWQTVTYDYFVDSGYTWAGAGTEDPPFAILDSIAFSMDFPHDSGPYAIYVDNIRNGSTIIEDFEGQTNGTPAYLFNLPNFSGSTSGNLLSPPPGSATPNVSVVTNLNAESGEHSAFLSWQFKDIAEGTWLRIPLQASGKRNPQVDLSQPISISFLVLPVGETEAALQVTSIGERQAAIGDDVTLEATPVGQAGTLTFQWRRDGADLTGETSSTFTIQNAQIDDSGAYSVVVSDGTCTVESFGNVTVSEEVPEPELMFARDGNTLTLTWDDPQAVLQSATELTGSPTDWTTVTGATSGHTEDISSGTKFFRLQR